MPELTDILTEAIEAGEVITLDYQGNERHIIPLVLGELKNGKEALLCYKVNGYDSNGPDLSIRLYHLHKIANVRKTGKEIPFSRKIDYYLTKHFRKTYAKV